MDAPESVRDAQSAKRIPVSVTAATAALLANLTLQPSGAWTPTIARVHAYREDELSTLGSNQPEALMLEPPGDASANSASVSHGSHSSHSSHTSHVSGSGSRTPPAPPPSPPSTPPPSQPSAPTTPTVTTPAVGPRRTTHPIEISTKSVVEELGTRPGYQSFLGRMIAAGVPFTSTDAEPRLIFAPIPSQFELLANAKLDTTNPKPVGPSLDSIVTYHVVAKRSASTELEKGCSLRTMNGQSIQVELRDSRLIVNKCAQVQSEIRCRDGAILTIDRVLQPSTQTLLQVLQDDGRFTQFVGAIEASGKGDLLTQGWLFTVLAPTDDAIHNSMGASWNDLMKQENAARLRAFVQRHLVAGRVLAEDLRKMSSVATGDAELPVTIYADSIQIAQAKIDQPDQNARNGVIHVLSRPLMP